MRIIIKVLLYFSIFIITTKGFLAHIVVFYTIIIILKIRYITDRYYIIVVFNT